MSQWSAEELKNLAYTAAAVLTAFAAFTIFSRRLREARYETFVLKNNGVEVHVSSLGAIIHKLFVTDARGNAVDVALGHKTLTEYTVSLLYISYSACTAIITAATVLFRDSSKKSRLQDAEVAVRTEQFASAKS